MSFSKKSRGFTLIELLVVLAVVAVITVIAAVSYTTILQKNRDNKRKSDLRELQVALEKYYSQNNYYPSGLTVSPNAGKISCDGATAIEWGNAFTCASTIYMKALPKDPVSTRSYYYRTCGAVTQPQAYAIFAQLEDANSAGTPTPIGDGGCSGSAPSSTPPYNYWVLSR